MIELHSRSAFSFLQAASQPEEMASRCAELGMPAMALLDCDGVYGAPRFHLAAKKLGIRAHIGAEIICEGFGRLPLLVRSRAGYQNLCRLITRMKLRAPKHPPAGEIISTNPSELAEFSSGLVCLTGGDDGPLALAFAGTHPNEVSRRALDRLAGIFGKGNLYVELQRHFSRAQEARNQAAVALARTLHLPLLASNAPLYALPEQRQLLDIFTCVRNHSTLDAAGRLLATNGERHIKSSLEMQQLFADLPEAIANTLTLSDSLDFTLADLGYEFPRYPVPEGETMMSFLRARTREGMRRRYRPLTERARRQIDRELQLIEQLDLAGYFLIVWDIVNFCREQNILVQGRGSAANSAVCYSLGITAVDPVGMDLLFERFLSEERGEWPDIDLDLPSGEQRERVIQHVYRKYGARGAAMTANVITYRGKSAAREVGKALGFAPDALDRLASLVSSWEYHDPQDTLERQFRDAGFELRHPRIRKFFELCMAVKDTPRHLGQHSGGMVICQGQLDSVVPLEPASMPGRVVVQWDKEDCSDMGLIKVDLLGLGMMAVLEDSIAIIRDVQNEEVDLAHLPPDDPMVYATLQKADTIGMFQIESRAQMSCLPRLQPTHFYDIVVQVAIIRPGPIVGKMVNPFLNRRQGKAPVTYPHPSLESVLERTLGVPLFQEQLLRMAMITAGFSGGQAEELRRAFGFKRSEARMRDIEIKLRRGMEQNGIDLPAQEQIIQAITSFALYGFPESHAASFALLAYASAYLKCHYLAAFTAALLNNQPMGFYHASTVVKDAQRHGLRMRPICVNRSEWLCTLEPDHERPGQFHLRVGLRYARGLREEAAQALLAARRQRPFTSLDDLVHRVPELRKNELVLLAEIGALNSDFTGTDSGSNETSPRQADSHSHSPSLGKLHRRSALWQIERATRPAGPLLEGIPLEGIHDREAPEVASPSDNVLSAPAALCPLSPMTHEERLVADFRGTGMTVGPHPMAYHRQRMTEMGVSLASKLPSMPSDQTVRIAGCVIARQRPGTAHGFVFLSIEDETGVANAIVTPQLFDRNRFVLAEARFLMVEGLLQNQDNVISVKAQRVHPLHLTAAATSSHDFH